jgi:hypothetical protein
MKTKMIGKMMFAAGLILAVFTGCDNDRNRNSRTTGGSERYNDNDRTGNTRGFTTDRNDRNDYDNEMTTGSTTHMTSGATTDRMDRSLDRPNDVNPISTPDSVKSYKRNRMTSGHSTK